jgi:hypothetical protein
MHGSNHSKNVICFYSVHKFNLLQAGRSRVRFLMSSLDFWIALILPTALWLESTQPLTEISTRNLAECKGRRVRLDNLTCNRESTVYKCGSLDASQPYGPPQPLTRKNIPFLRIVILICCCLSQTCQVRSVSWISSSLLHHLATRPADVRAYTDGLFLTTWRPSERERALDCEETLVRFSRDYSIQFNSILFRIHFIQIQAAMYKP